MRVVVVVLVVYGWWARAQSGSEPNDAKGLTELECGHFMAAEDVVRTYVYIGGSV